MSRSEAEDARLTKLALAARSGDRGALEGFIRGTQRDVWRFIAHLAGVHLADDLAQETYLRTLKSIRRFSGRSSARTWLLSIARRVVVDQVRYERSRPRTDAGADWAAAADRGAGERAGFEGIVELNMLLDELDGERREALLLTQVLGLSYQETAEVCGCPIGTVRSRVARAREQLLEKTAQQSEGTG
ncbi:sigma-70 family RNA polymerase sigma factor [Saccharopolyspora sp. 5N102]|uniref:sigma-70 family RNA polymerase sigma factor n=1 Tax=Saccharopolyspora sp. 5N102 TaxID=3375155 RepID=UPI0037B87D25